MIFRALNHILEGSKSGKAPKTKIGSDLATFGQNLDQKNCSAESSWILMNVCGVSFGGYLNKILSFKTGNLLNNSKFYLLSEGTVKPLLINVAVSKTANGQNGLDSCLKTWLRQICET